MRHKIILSILTLALITSYSTAIAQESKWTVFSSDAIDPKPIVWQTEDWNNYTEAENVPFRGYTFEYPKQWSFAGYSVFHDNKGRKVAEIAPGVITLAPTQRCFDKSLTDTPHTRSRPFRLGHVEGRFVVMSNVVFDDSPEEFRVHSYCIQEKHLTFTVTFLERSNQPELSKVFRHIIRSFKFANPVSPESGQ